jgi:hypothetical protein
VTGLLVRIRQKEEIAPVIAHVNGPLCIDRRGLGSARKLTKCCNSAVSMKCRSDVGLQFPKKILSNIPVLDLQM